MLRIISRSVVGSEAEAQPSVVTYKDLHSFSEQQLLKFLEPRGSEEGFDCSDVTGRFGDGLEDKERDELADKLVKAIEKLSIAPQLDLDHPQGHLQAVADGTENRVIRRRGSTESISGADLTPVNKLERSCYQAIAREGGRPVCSIEELLDIHAAPATRHHAVRPWLTKDIDDHHIGIVLETVFSRQYMQWWEFRKFQWDSRGLDNTGAGLTAFIGSRRRVDVDAGRVRLTRSRDYEYTRRKQWEKMLRGVPIEHPTFTAYSNAVKLHLAPHGFTVRLSKDPQKQSAWTDWLEYLGFELLRQELLTARVESLEPDYNACRKKLLDIEPPLRPLDSEGNEIPPDLEEALAELDEGHKAIDKFFEGTKWHAKAGREAYYQKHRVEWVIKEAHIMQNERSQARKDEKKRRQHIDEEPTASGPKKPRHRGGGGGGESATPATTGPRRSTRAKPWLNTRKPSPRV